VAAYHVFVYVVSRAGKQVEFEIFILRIAIWDQFQLQDTFQNPLALLVYLE